MRRSLARRRKRWATCGAALEMTMAMMMTTKRSGGCFANEKRRRKRRTSRIDLGCPCRFDLGLLGRARLSRCPDPSALGLGRDRATVRCRRCSQHDRGREG
jgi:hypothetical protein